MEPVGRNPAHCLPIRTWVMGKTVFADGRVVDDGRGQEIAFDHQRGGYWGG